MPNLQTLVLTNNTIVELGDLEPLRELRHLQFLTLLGNPVTEKKWYREWLAWRIPGLRVIDFQRIRDKVRSPAPLSPRCCCESPRAEILSCIIPGAYAGKGAVRYAGGSPHRAGDDYLDLCVDALDEDGPDDRRAQGRAYRRQSRSFDVKRGPREGQSSHRKGDFHRGSQEARTEPQRGIRARIGLSRGMITIGRRDGVLLRCSDVVLFKLLSLYHENMSVPKIFVALSCSLIVLKRPLEVLRMGRLELVTLDSSTTNV